MKNTVMKKPPTTAELFGLNTKQNKNVKGKEISPSENVKNYNKCGTKNVESPLKSSPNKNTKNTKKIYPTKQKYEFIEPEMPTSGSVNIAIVKFTSDGKEYKFLISDKINFDNLSLLKEQYKALAVYVWCTGSKKKEAKKTSKIAFIVRLEKLDLNKTKENKPTSWVYKVCKNQDDKKFMTNKELLKFYKNKKLLKKQNTLNKGG